MKKDLQRQYGYPKETGLNFYTSPSGIGHFVVSREMQDGTKKVIGYVSQYGTSEEADATLFSAVDCEGNRICPETSSWSEIENEFERHARQITQEERMNALREIREEIKERKHEKEITH